jgi:hypothetical protein
MAYSQNDMVFKDYKWTARADQDNPYYRGGSDAAQLNRQEGYEILYFINHIGKKHWKTEPSTATYQKIERMIRNSVPGNIRSRDQIASWIVSNWNNV